MELLDIEKELCGPDKMAAMDKYDQQLIALSNRVQQTLDTGVTPGEFRKCEQLAEAVTVARKLLRLQVKD